MSGVTRSEVAVLVLGYLEREGFRNAAAAFASESHEQRARVQLPPHERPMDLVRLVSEYDRLVRSGGGGPSPRVAAPPAGSRGEVARMYRAMQGIMEDYESLHRSGGAALRSTAATAAAHGSPSRRKKRQPRRHVAQSAALHDVGDAADGGAATAFDDPVGVGDRLADELTSTFGVAGEDGDFDLFDLLTAGNEDSFLPLAAQVAEHINRSRAADGGTARVLATRGAPSRVAPPPAAPAAAAAATEPFGAAAIAAQHIISDPALSTTFGALVRSGSAAAGDSPAHHRSPAELARTTRSMRSPALTPGSGGKRARAHRAGESEFEAPAAKTRLRRPVLGSGGAASALLGANVNALLNALHPVGTSRGAGLGAAAAPSSAGGGGGRRAAAPRPNPSSKLPGDARTHEPTHVTRHARV